MARSIARRRIAELTPQSQSSSFLSPMPPEQAGQRLEVAINGERRPNQLTLTATRGRFQGSVQGPSFWVQSRSAAWNLMERRLEGTLLSNAGSTEVRCELRLRPAALGTVMALIATLVTATIVALGVVLAFAAVDHGSIATFLFWLLGSTLAAFWVLVGGSIFVGRRLARSGEQGAVEFLTTVLDAPTSDLG